MKNGHIKIVDIEINENVKVTPAYKGTSAVRVTMNAKDRAVHNYLNPWSKIPEYVQINVDNPRKEK